MVSSVTGNKCGCQGNSYNNQILLNDETNTNMYPPSNLGMDPLLSMNNSIFGNGMTSGMVEDMASGVMPGSTMSSMMPGMMMPGMMMSGMTPGMMMPGMMMPGMGYMPPFTGNNGNSDGSTTDPYEAYYDQYNKYMDFMTDSQVRMQQKQRAADLRLNAPTEGVEAHASFLKDKILRNEQGQIKGAYESFVKSVQALYGDDADKAQVTSRANSFYKRIHGKTVVDDIREHGRDSFTQGALQSITFGLFNRKTAEETVSELTGQPVGKEERAKKVAGNIVGGAAVGGTAFAIFTPLIKGLQIAKKSHTFWGIVIGAAAGGFAAIMGSK